MGVPIEEGVVGTLKFLSSQLLDLVVGYASSVQEDVVVPEPLLGSKGRIRFVLLSKYSLSLFKTCLRNLSFILLLLLSFIEEYSV